MGTFNGTPDNDYLNGTDDADHMIGGDGHDYLYGEFGDDLIEGGAGNDWLDGEDGTDVLYGGDGDDILQNHSDSSIAGAENDRFYGEGGNDRIYTYVTTTDSETVVMDGGSGNDSLTFDAWWYTHDVTLVGGEGDDDIYINAARRIAIDAGDGADRVAFNFSGSTESITLTLGAGADIVQVARQRFTNNDLPAPIRITDFEGGAAGDRISVDSFLWLLTGWDRVASPFATGHLALVQSGADAVLRLDFDGGGDALQDFIVFEGTDSASLGLFNIGFRSDGSSGPGLTLVGDGAANGLVGSGESDLIQGLDGDDSIAGNSGDDVIEGGLGADAAEGGWGHDRLYGGDGNDNLYDYHSGDDEVYGGEGNDRLTAERNQAAPFSQLLLDGGSGNDELRYAPFNETPYRRFVDDVTLLGGDGDDYIYVNSPRSASIDAGSGNDRVTLAHQGSEFIVTLGDGVDVLSLETTRAVGGSLTVTDFQAGAAGDRLEIDSYLRVQLPLWDPTTHPFERGFLQIVQRGADAVLQIDRDGPSGTGAFADLILFQNVDSASFTGTNLGGYSLLQGSETGETINGTEGIDFIQGFGGNDVLKGAGNGDTLEGGDGDDRLEGGQGKDKLDGGAGADTMIGGNDDDLYIVDDLGDVVVEAGESGSTDYSNDEVRTGLAVYTLAAEVEKLTGTSDSGQTLTGNARPNTVAGGAGNDVIRLLGGDNSARGNSGDDWIEGGDGKDTIYGGQGSDILLGLGGDDFLSASIVFNDAQSDINRLEGGDGNDTLWGGHGHDTLLGGGGNDWLRMSDGGTDLFDGGDGDDRIDPTRDSGFVGPGTVTVIGGAGNDTVGLGPGGAWVVDLGSGDDRLNLMHLIGSFSLTLGAGSDTISFLAFPYVEFWGSATVTDFATGAGGDQMLLKAFLEAWLTDWDKVSNPFSTGHLRLVQSGADTLLQFDRDGGGDALVTRILFQGTNVVDFTHANLDGYALPAMVGTDGADTIRGGAGDNGIEAGAGNDVLLLQDGGNDGASGGEGNDIFYFGTALSAGDVADGGAGRDAIVLQGNVTAVLTDTNLIGVESISIQSGANSFFGDTANAFYDYDVTTADGNVAAGQQMIVNAQSLRVGEDFTFDGSAETNGKFVVYGGHGVDDLTGADGADIFFFEGQRWGPNDKVDGGDGRDSVAISAGSGLAHIEFGADSITNIESISLNNFFASDPTQKPSYELVLHNGNVAPGGTLIVNGSSIPLGQVVNIDGSGVHDGNLMLFAGGGHDVLTGGAGGDLILGGGGADSLTGGAGADTFRYDSVADSAGLADLIGDFLTGTDKIDLSRIDANSHSAGNQAFSWIGSAAFSGSGAASAGELRLFEDGGYQRIEGDIDGDGLADLVILLQIGTAPLAQGDFLP